MDGFPLPEIGVRSSEFGVRSPKGYRDRRESFRASHLSSNGDIRSSEFGVIGNTKMNDTL